MLFLEQLPSTRRLLKQADDTQWFKKELDKVIGSQDVPQQHSTMKGLENASFSLETQGPCMIFGTNDTKESMQDFRSRSSQHGWLKILSSRLLMVPIECLLSDCSIFLFLWFYLISKNSVASCPSCDLWIHRCQTGKHYKKLSTVLQGGFSPLSTFMGSYSLLWNKLKWKQSPSPCSQSWFWPARFFPAVSSIYRRVVLDRNISGTSPQCSPLESILPSRVWGTTLYT